MSVLVFPAPASLRGENLAREIEAALGLPAESVDVALDGNEVKIRTDATQQQVAPILATHTGAPSAAETNETTVSDQLDQALVAMRAHVTRGTFTAQQRDAALLLVLRVCIGLVKLARRRFDTAD